MNPEGDKFRQAEDLYRRGKFNEAFPLFVELAEGGRVGCQRFVGWMFFCGEGTDGDLRQAYKWFERAANSGDREAKFGAGRVCLASGDDALAHHWFELACADGFAAACFRLGMMYRDGRGRPQDLDAASLHFDKAYSNGNLPAGRAQAVLMISGGRGPWARLAGVCLLVKVVVQVVVEAIRDRNSQRLMM